MFAPQRLDAARETRPARARAPALPEGADAPPAAVPGGRPTALHFISDHVAASLVHEPPKPWRRDGIGAEGGSAGFHLGFWRSPGTAGRPQDTRGLLSHDVTVAGDATAPRAGCRHPEPRYNPTFASHDLITHHADPIKMPHVPLARASESNTSHAHEVDIAVRMCGARFYRTLAPAHERPPRTSWVPRPVVDVAFDKAEYLLPVAITRCAAPHPASSPTRAPRSGSSAVGDATAGYRARLCAAAVAQDIKAYSTTKHFAWDAQPEEATLYAAPPLPVEREIREEAEVRHAYTVAAAASTAPAARNTGLSSSLRTSWVTEEAAERADRRLKMLLISNDASRTAASPPPRRLAATPGGGGGGGGRRAASSGRVAGVRSGGGPGSLDVASVRSLPPL